MGDFAAWLKEQVRKTVHLKAELIKTHTGLAPPAFFAVVALAAAGTALTVSAVSSFLAPPKKNDKLLDAIIEEEIMPFTPSNQREVDVVIPVVHETPIVEAAKEDEYEEVEEEAAPVDDVEAPVEEEIEAPAEEEEAEAVETTVPAAADGDDNISSDYVDFEEETVV
jgi:hypothetical protein